MFVAGSSCILAGALVSWAGHASDIVVGQHVGDGHVREDVPTLVQVAMEGIALDRCSGDDVSAARRCTQLVPGPTVFPAWGTPTEREAAMQALRSLFADFDVTFVEEAPPEFVPQMLAVVGGTSSLIGQEMTTCGTATLVCGGQRRDLVSLTFAHSCGGWELPTRVASTIAQETAHNLGLEHVNMSDDVMFPTVSQSAQTFRDACLDILTAGYDDAWLCPDVHVLDCPEGGGGQQSSYAELLRVAGPSDPDSAAPQIVSIAPDDGASFAAGETIAVVARVAHHSEDLGVRWTWVDGPDGAFEPGPGVTRCTNGVCDLDYDDGKAIDSDWDFVALVAPPAGTYVFRLEVADAHGHHETRMIAFDVLDGDTGGSSESSSTTESADDANEGCGCGGSPDRSWSMLSVLPLMRRRRRRVTAGRGPGRP